MKITNKRLVSILLCLAMVLAILPMAVFAADTTTVYYYNASNWSTVSVYWWGSAGSNPGWPGNTMTDLGNGYWSYEIPSDLVGKEGVIFNNANGAQTANLTMPTTGENCFNGSSWIEYTGEEIEVVIDYYLRGEMNGWDTSAKMTDNGDGTYSITMDLAAGTYEYKAAIADWSWSCPAGDNASLTLETDDTVTFTLDVAANTVTVSSGSVVEPEPMVIESVIAVGAGSGNFLYGFEWDPAASMNAMEGVDGVYTVTYMGVAAGTYEYKFAANGNWDISWGAGCETVSGEIYDAWFNGNNNILNVTADGSVVVLTLDLSAMDYVTGEGATCSVQVIEPAVSSAPETLVLGDNAFEVVDGDTSALTSTYTATEAGILVVNVTAMSTYDANSGEWSDVPAAYIPMQFGRMYAVLINGRQAWLPGEVEIAAGDVVEIGIQSYMGNAVKATVNLSIREPGVNDVKWQLPANASPNDATTDLRLMTWVDSLDYYSSVTFNVSVDGVAKEPLTVTNVYSAVMANGQAVAAADLFGYQASYIATYVITDVPVEAYDSEIQVTVTWTDMDGNETTSETRTFVISDNWA